MNRTNLNSEDVKKVNRYTLFSETPPSRNLFFFLKVSIAWVYSREDWVRGEKGLYIICVKVNQEGDNWQGFNNRGTQNMCPFICNKMYSWCLLTHFLSLLYSVLVPQQLLFKNIQSNCKYLHWLLSPPQSIHANDCTATFIKKQQEPIQIKHLHRWRVKETSATVSRMKTGQLLGICFATDKMTVQVILKFMFYSLVFIFMKKIVKVSKRK